MVCCFFITRIVLQSHCEKMSGHLVDIHTEQEQQFLEGWLGSMFIFLLNYSSILKYCSTVHDNSGQLDIRACL